MISEAMATIKAKLVDLSPPETYVFYVADFEDFLNKTEGAITAWGVAYTHTKTSDSRANNTSTGIASGAAAMAEINFTLLLKSQYDSSSTTDNFLVALPLLDASRSAFLGLPIPSANRTLSYAGEGFVDASNTGAVYYEQLWVIRAAIRSN